MADNTTLQVLTNREFDIMSILWQAETSLVASEIAKRGNNLTVNTTQAVIKKLLNRKLIAVDTIVYSGTVLTRSYKPTITADEFELEHLIASFQKLSNKPMTTSSFVASLLEQEKDSTVLLSEIEQLEQLLESKKCEIKGNKST